MNLTQYISKNFNLAELADTALQLDFDPENLPPQKMGLVRELILAATRHSKLINLWASLQGWGKGSDFKPYLYLQIAARVNTAEKMQSLADKLWINYSRDLVQGLGYHTPSSNPDVITAQAKKVIKLEGVTEDLLTLVLNDAELAMVRDMGWLI